MTTKLNKCDVFVCILRRIIKIIFLTICDLIEANVVNVEIEFDTRTTKNHQI